MDLNNIFAMNIAKNIRERESARNGVNQLSLKMSNVRIDDKIRSGRVNNIRSTSIVAVFALSFPSNTIGSFSQMQRRYIHMAHSMLVFEQIALP